MTNDKLSLTFEAFRAKGDYLVATLETGIYNPYTEGVGYSVTVPALTVTGEKEIYVPDAGSFRVKVVI